MLPAIVSRYNLLKYQTNKFNILNHLKSTEKILTFRLLIACKSGNLIFLNAGSGSNPKRSKITLDR